MSNQNKSDTNTKNSKEKWIYLYISGLTAVILSFIYAILTLVEIVQAIIMIIATVFIIGLICFFGYLISKSNLRSVESSLNMYIKQNLETPIDRHIKHLEECCTRMEIYSKQKKIATIDSGQISNFIQNAETIWVMNPLEDLSSRKEKIKESLRNGCARKYIISTNDKVYYENFKREICCEVYGKSPNGSQGNFRLIALPPEYMFPLSFVICDPKSPSKASVWVQPTRKIETKDEDYGLYIADGRFIRQFMGTFSAFEKLEIMLKKGGS